MPRANLLDELRLRLLAATNMYQPPCRKEDATTLDWVKQAQFRAWRIQKKAQIRRCGSVDVSRIGKHNCQGSQARGERGVKS